MMIRSHEAIPRRKLSDEVRDRLLDLIREDRLAPGDALPSERSLMQRFQVGRPAVREALQSLEQTGIIEIRHGDRARIAEPSIGRMLDQMSETAQHILTNSSATLENLKEARLMFEVEMVRRAAKTRSDADVGRLWDRIAEQERALENPMQFLQCDGAFHREIAAISGNPIFTAVSESMFRWLSVFHQSLVRVPGREDLTLSEHRKIAEAIGARSAERAAKVMTDHLNRANKLYHQAHNRGATAAG